MTTTTDAPMNGSAGRFRRRSGPLLGAAAMLLFVLAARTLTDGFSVHTTITESSCQDGFCVQRRHSPDLLLVPGRREVRVLVRDAQGHTQPRFLTEDDPFGPYADVKITWTEGGVRLTDGAAVLSWDAAALNSLDD